ncbi:hypothetical protein [Priestia megaterium]|jgi:hypothetical protein|uniref:hypothetical protein n=1 Tax=Priestia megaterium TaxID=1404 RepID=UPI0015DC788D|nr:hypothetical protein [Priestia megaterium]QLK05303.1 hypothetical protein BMG_1800 [Priestia megaterium]
MDGVNVRAKSLVMKEKELKDITGDVRSAGFYMLEIGLLRQLLHSKLLKKQRLGQKYFCSRKIQTRLILD